MKLISIWFKFQNVWESLPNLMLKLKSLLSLEEKPTQTKYMHVNKSKLPYEIAGKNLHCINSANSEVTLMVVQGACSLPAHCAGGNCSWILRGRHKFKTLELFGEFGLILLGVLMLHKWFEGTNHKWRLKNPVLF